jgi:hypothetical protein
MLSTRGWRGYNWSRKDRPTGVLLIGFVNRYYCSLSREQAETKRSCSLPAARALLGAGPHHVCAVPRCRDRSHESSQPL